MNRSHALAAAAAVCFASASFDALAMDESQRVAQASQTDAPTMRTPDGDPGTGAAPEAEPDSFAGAMLKMFLVLGIIVGLIYLTLNYGLRRFMGLRGFAIGRSGLVRVVERIALDPKRSLFVVHAAGEYLLVGAGDHQLSLISRLNADEVKRLLEQQPAAGAQPSPFLQKLLLRKGEPPPAGKDVT